MFTGGYVLYMFAHGPCIHPGNPEHSLMKPHGKQKKYVLIDVKFCHYYKSP